MPRPYKIPTSHIRRKSKIQDPKSKMVSTLWSHLHQIQSLTFVAQSSAQTGWNGRGRGRVQVESVNDQCLLFHERGFWEPEEGRSLRFRNVFRWSWVPDSNSLRLEHLRFGAAHPVLLFDLVQVEPQVWRSLAPHDCGADQYVARLTQGDQGISVHWTVTGPRKQEAIAYQYSGHLPNDPLLR